MSLMIKGKCDDASHLRLHVDILHGWLVSIVSLTKDGLVWERIIEWPNILKRHSHGLENSNEMNKTKVKV